MLIKRFTNLYPRTLWIVIIENNEDISNLCKQFEFFELEPGFDVIDNNAENYITESYEGDSIAECRVVAKKSNGEIGIICMIYRPDVLDSATAAHESVHIADYFFEITGMAQQDLSEAGGNEHYAYLVGWSAGCFTKVMEQYYGKTK